ncbi:MAG: hypothetical protein AAF677_12605 [Pseudomonadota bacterium]
MVEVRWIAILDSAGQPLNRTTATHKQHARSLFTHILGLRTDRLRVSFELAPGSAAPERLSIQGLVRGAGTQGAEKPRLRFRARATKTGDTPARYAVDARLHNINGLMARDRQREFCTIVREHGTSADLFARQLGSWHNRGQAVQPDRGKDAVTGDAAREIPDAHALMVAGGVEVMEVWAADEDGADPSPLKTWAFVRSPADVVFYSGHGGWWNGALLRGTVFGHTYDDWLTPETLLVEWQADRGKLIGAGDIELLVINGCSVLLWNLDPSTSLYSVRRKSHGKVWAGLLKSKGGPLSAICGYRHTAPIDQPFGNKVAERFAARLQKGLTSSQYASAWMDVNRPNPATWTACAWDTTGYRYINMPGLNSFDAKHAVGAVIGPIPLN